MLSKIRNLTNKCGRNITFPPINFLEVFGMKDIMLYNHDNGESILLSDLINNYIELDPEVYPNGIYHRRFVEKNTNPKDYEDLEMDYIKLPNIAEKVYVDSKITDIIMRLNDEGYYTDYCCSGHKFESQFWFNKSKSSIFLDTGWYIIYAKAKYVSNKEELEKDGGIPTNVCRSSGYISFRGTYPDLEEKILNSRENVVKIATKESAGKFYRNEYKTKDLVFYLDKASEYTENITALYWAFDPDKYSVDKVMKKLKSILF
jgi:hypothetical protein